MVFIHKTIVNNLESEKTENRKPPNSNCRQSLVWGLLGVDVVMSARPRVIESIRMSQSVSHSSLFFLWPKTKQNFVPVHS